jgi:hypothetical protein
VYELIIGWCASGAILMIEHLVFAPKDTPLWPRYAMGVAALLAGAWVLEWVAGRPAGALDLTLISTSGVLIFGAYAFRDRYNKDIIRAQELGHIDGRIEEANRQARSARHSNN